MSLKQIEDEYDAIFIGVGLGADSRLDVPGKTLPNVRGAVEFIEDLKNRPTFDLGHVKCAAVIGLLAWIRPDRTLRAM